MSDAKPTLVTTKVRVQVSTDRPIDRKYTLHKALGALVDAAISEGFVGATIEMSLLEEAKAE